MKEPLPRMPQQEGTEQLISLYEQIRPLLLSLGLTHTTVAYNRDLIDAKENEFTIKWLKAFTEVHVVNLNKAKSRMTPERFTILESYDDLSEGVWEWDQYIAAKQALITEWRARPNLLKKGISVEQAKREEQRDIKRKQKTSKRAKGSGKVLRTPDVESNGVPEGT